MASVAVDSADLPRPKLKSYTITLYGSWLGFLTTRNVMHNLLGENRSIMVGRMILSRL